MVSQIEAAKSSGISSILVAASHGTAHYILGGASQLTDPVVTGAGITVFAATFTVSYAGMRGIF